MTFMHIDINFDITYDSLQKPSKCPLKIILMTFICDNKLDINICEAHHVNLVLLWAFSIVQVTGFLTFDIFLTIWHLLTLAHKPRQPVTGQLQLNLVRKFEIRNEGVYKTYISWVQISLAELILNGTA